MTWTPISGTLPQYQKSDGTLASGYYLKFYQAGTTTAFSMATDSTGVTTLAKCQINSSGYPVNGSGDPFIPHVDQSYKIVLYKNSTDADADTTANAEWVIDNIETYEVGSNDVYGAFSGAPTQTSAITFTLTGDQTSIFSVGTKLRLTDATTVYGIVTASSFSSVTTVTVLATASLTGSLSSVEYAKSTDSGQSRALELDARNYVVPASRTITNNIKIPKGGLISVSASQTLTISGEVEAGLYQIFTGSGSVTGFSAKMIFPQWWGATGDGVTDDTTAIQAALDYAGGLGNAIVSLVPGETYYFTSTLSIPSGVVLKSDSSERSVAGLLSDVAGSESINIANGYYQGVENISLNHATPGSAGTGIRLIDNDGAGSGTDSPQYFKCRNVTIRNHATGVRIANESTWCVFVDVIATLCSSSGFSVSNANLTVFERCISDTCDTGWFIENTTKTILNDCTAQVCASTSSAAVLIDGCDNTCITNLWTERNEYHNVHIRGASRLVRLTECMIQGSGFSGGAGTGLLIDGTSDNTYVDGGWFGNNTTSDITINASATKTVILYPRSNVALSYTDNSGKAMLFENGNIRFPSTQVPSSNVNTLDDYKEGTWTPTLITSGTNFDSVTYDSLTGGRYTKVGNVVHIQLAIRTDAITVGSATGNIRIGGLPYTSVASSGSTGDGNASFTVGYAVSFAANMPSSAIVPASANYFDLYYRSTAPAGSSPLAVSDIGTGANANYMLISGSYITT